MSEGQETMSDDIRALAEWHERQADQADSITGRTMHLWAADMARSFARTAAATR